ncbi:hypothetical protein LVD17_22735 [Fulvivirga ulvae]|uniref:type II restriction endonuclease n=1 Tax=Fulvivirga ulvae TaxID=2904245 RepID=UPI001F1CC2E1|nr:type II restriction endonuclease [Fulvivirga ulvae]UII31112.1 hypothetical protein LVD17_22735 [Fulvivirga ulvae]
MVTYGYINKFFTGVGAKRLSEVEVSPAVSNQHEFNGITEFKEIFGTAKINFTAKYIYLADDEESTITEEGTLTWYNARENHATRTEYRLYYSANEVISTSTPGDLIVICRVSENELFIIVTPEGSTSEKQILWLFGLGEVGNKFKIRDFTEEQITIDFAGKYIINSLGIEVEETIDDYLDELLNKFGNKFPKTQEFSEYARSTIKNVSPVEAPDETLMAWLEKEEMLFRTLEKHIVQQKLKQGFGKNGTDVDEFVTFSLSVQNRRKSRAGHAFENHLATLFDSNELCYSKGVKTERNNKPDFLFPGIKKYKDAGFSEQLLTMLGVKTTAKDRWRQVLAEADRIRIKHLITLQPAISENQTDEMKAQSISLVVPSPLLSTFSKGQQTELLTVKDFIKLVRDKQA